MDNHWRQMTDLKETIDGMQTTIADDQAASLIRSQCLTTQLDGLRSTSDQATTTDRSNIMDIHAWLIPELCSWNEMLATDIQHIHARLNRLNALPIPPPEDVGASVPVDANVFPPTRVDSEDDPPPLRWHMTNNNNMTT
jgi:hypothetical protein